MNFSSWLDIVTFMMSIVTALTLFLTCTCSREPPTPSILGKRRRKTMTAKSPKIISWDREKVCLPQSYMDLFGSDSVLPIPRKKDTLASFGLVGKVYLESHWTATEVVEVNF